MKDINTYEAVSKMQAYIKEHLHETITLYQLASVSGYSMWHASRLFKTLTGKTPFDYIRSLRLSKAALDLRDQDHQIIDVAFDYHFDSHEGFTKAFTKQFGLNPSLYKQRKPPIKLFLPTSVKDYFLFLNQKPKEYTMDQSFIFTQVVKRPKRKLILKRGIKAEDYFAYCEEVSCDVWGELLSIKHAISEPAGYWLPKHLRDGKSTYVQGVEVDLDDQTEIPEGYDVLILDEAYYLIFQGEPYEDEELNYAHAIHDVKEAIKKFNPETYGYQFTDIYPRYQLEPQGERGYIEAVGIKPISKDTF